MKKIALLLTALILVSCHTIILQWIGPTVTLSVTGTTPTSASLAWTKDTSATFASYKLYRSVDSTVTTGDDSVYASNNSDDTTFTDSTLTPNDTCYYKLFVHFTGGDSAESNMATAVTPAPGHIAAVLSITQTGAYSISLAWTQDTSADFLSYIIFRSENPGVTVADDFVSAIINRADTTLVDDSLCPNQTYYYTLFSVFTNGDTLQSNEADSTTGVPTELSIGVCPYRIVSVGDTFSINVWIGAVVDLYGASMELEHDSTKIEAIDGVRGDFLGADVLFQCMCDPGLTSISNVKTSGGGVDGTGILATVRYRALATGQTPLSFVDATLSLEDSTGATVGDPLKKEGLVIIQ